MSNLGITLITILVVIVYLVMGVGFYKVQKRAEMRVSSLDIFLWPLGLVMICLFP